MMNHTQISQVMAKDGTTGELDRLRAENAELRAAIRDQCKRIEQENDMLRACLQGTPVEPTPADTMMYPHG